MKRGIAAVLVLTLLWSSPAALAVGSGGFDRFTDVSGHWAEAGLRRAYEDGLLQGTGDDSMSPDMDMTGAQMAAILVRVLNATQTADLTGAGLSSDCWYADAASRAVALGILSPADVPDLDRAMTREEACRMLSDAFQLEQGDADRTAAGAYSDFYGLSSEEKTMVATLVNEGYLQGWNGSLMLAEPITRAEFVTILYRVADEYATPAEVDGTAAGGTVLHAGQTVSLHDRTFAGKVWLDCAAENVTLQQVTAPVVTLRGDRLTGLDLAGSKLGRLVLATRSGDVDLHLPGAASVQTVVVGAGAGTVTLNAAVPNVEVTGSGRKVLIAENAEQVVISGSGNQVTIATETEVSRLMIQGENNKVIVGAAVQEMETGGKENQVTGTGETAQNTLYSSTTQVLLSVGSTVDCRDQGISGMTAAISAPETLEIGETLTATASFTNVPEGKTVTAAWTLDGRECETETLTLSDESRPTFQYRFSYTKEMNTSAELGFSVQYTTKDGETQTVSASPVTVQVENYGEAYYAAQDPDTVLEKVTSVYRGDGTTQWAEDHDLEEYEKEIFVNTKGYSSSTQDLIWINIGTQHVSVFQGQQGAWKLALSGLVSTGVEGNTPIGVWDIYQKQIGWFEDTYTVLYVCRFYGDGFAMHSRLYEPDSDTLQTNGNGLGYPLSHGCVRMELDTIKWIYQNCPLGTTVVIF